jgi:alpha-mannosidase
VHCHGWADVSRRDRGAALLSDGKYGYRVKDGALELHLLRSALYPGPVLVRDGDVKPGEPHHGFTDQCDHEFAYALFPHPGDHVAGRVVREASEMAFPIRVAASAPAPDAPKAGGKTAPLPARGSFLAVDAEHVVLETVKRAEDDDGVVLRLYESSGAAAKARVTLSLAVEAAEETDLMEGNGRRLAVRDDSFTLSFGPFEIKTVKVRLR